MDTAANPSGTPPQAHAKKSPRTLRELLFFHPSWTVAAVLLVAFNLRPALTSIAPFIRNIGFDLQLSGFALSVLTTAPVICLGLFSPAAPPLARRFGTEAVLLAALLGIVVGVVFRSFGAVPLFMGTLIIGASMSLLGVLSPVIVKRDFPTRIGLMMGMYTMLISLGAAMSTATAVPLRHALGDSWQMALLFWSLPALVGAIVFIPQLFRHKRAVGVASARVQGLMRDPLAWQVTAFLSLVASMAYAVFSWGPTMLQSRGLSAVDSGLVMSTSYVAQMVTGLTAPIVAGRMRDQRAIVVVLIGITAIGLLGLIFAPVSGLSLYAILLGLGQGGSFGLALSLILLRAGNPQTAAQLSGLSQSIGYVVAGLIGPLAVGVLFDWTGSWRLVAIFYMVLCLGALVAGLGAGRARVVKVTARA